MMNEMEKAYVDRIEDERNAYRKRYEREVAVGDELWRKLEQQKAKTLSAINRAKAFQMHYKRVKARADKAERIGKECADMLEASVRGNVNLAREMQDLDLKLTAEQAHHDDTKAELREVQKKLAQAVRDYEAEEFNHRLARTGWQRDINRGDLLLYAVWGLLAVIFGLLMAIARGAA